MKESWKQEELINFNNSINRTIYYELLNRLEEAKKFFKAGDIDTAYRLVSGFTIIIEQSKFDINDFSDLVKTLNEEEKK
jgi:hypothetical protein